MALWVREMLPNPVHKGLPFKCDKINIFVFCDPFAAADLFGGEMVELEVAVVLLRPAAATLADLDRHRTRDHVAGRQVLKWESNELLVFNRIKNQI